MIAILIYVVVNITHAAGHLLAARLFKIRVERLSLGLGPTLWQRSWRGTTVRITPIPLGLFVRLRPRWNKGEQQPAAEPGDFRGASALTQLVVICAPLLVLLLLGWGAAFHLHGVGIYRLGSARVGGLQEGGPAEAAGLRRGDVIARVDGGRVGGWKALQRLVGASRGRPLKLVVRRGEAALELEVTPRQSGERWLLGVVAGQELVRVEGTAARAGAAASTVRQTLGQLVTSLWSIIMGGTESVVAGPVQIVEQLGSKSVQAEASRQAKLVVVSILNYLFICLLPVPWLDGRRLVFWLVGLAARGRLHPRWEQGFNRWGFAAVGVLLLVVMLSDVSRFLS